MGCPFTIWAETAHLVLDDEGVLWSSYKDGWTFHGSVEDLDVPEAWAGEAAELLDLWQDAQGYDVRAQVWWDYRRK